MVKRSCDARLEDWFLYEENPNCSVLCGVVYGHYFIEDGHRVRTSPTMSKTFIDGILYYNTYNTRYEMGVPAKELDEVWTMKLKLFGCDLTKVRFM